MFRQTVESERSGVLGILSQKNRYLTKSYLQNLVVPIKTRGIDSRLEQAVSAVGKKTFPFANCLLQQLLENEMLRYIASVSKIFSKNSNGTFRNKATVNAFDYQNLEQRKVLAGITFDVSSGFITILGSSGDDFSFVSNPVPTQVQVSLTGFPTQMFPASQVTRVFFEGLAGNDFISNTTGVPLEADGGEGVDRLFGGTGNDELRGGDGDDILGGGAGNDTLLGGGGIDSINCGAGNDFADGQAGNDVIFGVSGTNQLYGGDGNDQIVGGTQDDQSWGGVGDDSISTGEGNNFVDGGDGNDTITSASATSNILLGGNGNDYIRSGNATSRIEGGLGNDTLVGGNGIDFIFGQGGNDVIRGGSNNDYLDGGSGNDRIFGDDGDDELAGGNGDDLMNGGNGNERMFGGVGNDTISGGAGNDEIFGQDGNDIVYGEGGDDVIFGNAGNDMAYGMDGNDKMYGGDGDDLLNGGAGDDLLDGQNGNDSMIGADGNDRLYGGNGNDILNAGNGNNGLFGGINGTKQLVGGTGKNRFLVAETATNQLSNFKSSDAQINFRNGNRAWSNAEIFAVDGGLHDLHMRAGNTRILKATFTNRPLVFIKDLAVDSIRYGFNSLETIQENVIDPITGQITVQTYQEHQIRLPEWNELDATSNLVVRAEVAHEIGHIWASDASMAAAHPPLNGVFSRFSNVSGWTNVEPPQGVIADYYKSQDNQWWYFRTATFTESNANYNPAADFAASFKYYFDPRVNPADRVAFTEKMEIIDEIFAKLSSF